MQQCGLVGPCSINSWLHLKRKLRRRGKIDARHGYHVERSNSEFRPSPVNPFGDYAFRSQRRGQRFAWGERIRTRKRRIAALAIAWLLGRSPLASGSTRGTRELPCCQNDICEFESGRAGDSTASPNAISRASSAHF